MEIIKTSTLNEPDISFIIPVHNEEKYLPVTLNAIRNQKTDLKAEVILIDDRSEDKTKKTAEGYNCTVYENIKDTGNTQLNVTQLRNFGFEKSHGKTIMHMDGDTAFSVNYMEKMVKPLITGKADTTLVFWHEPLEVRYPILPEKYSKSYAWFLHNLPHFFWGKIPVRFFIWIGLWIKTCIKKKRMVPLFSIPDRINGSGLITRREIPEKFGGWKKAFGAHSDTDYSLNCIKFSNRIKWITGTILYYSCRRYFPENNSWLIKKILKPFNKMISLFGKKRKNPHIDPEKGYINPEGKR